MGMCDRMAQNLDFNFWIVISLNLDIFGRILVIIMVTIDVLNKIKNLITMAWVNSFKFSQQFFLFFNLMETWNKIKAYFGATALRHHSLSLETSFG